MTWLETLAGQWMLVLPLAVPAAGLLFMFITRVGRAARPEADSEPADTLPLPAAVRPAVLVVDDSAVVRAKLQRLLAGAGYRVMLAENGKQAQAALAREPFALMITDLEMPEVDGFELIAWAQGRRTTEDLPIIAITGHEELHARVYDLQGLFGLYRKPWNDADLLKRVATLAALRVPA